MHPTGKESDGHGAAEDGQRRPRAASAPLGGPRASEELQQVGAERKHAARAGPTEPGAPWPRNNNTHTRHQSAPPPMAPPPVPFTPALSSVAGSPPATLGDDDDDDDEDGLGALPAAFAEAQGDSEWPSTPAAVEQLEATQQSLAAERQRNEKLRAALGVFEQLTAQEVLRQAERKQMATRSLAAARRWLASLVRTRSPPPRRLDYHLAAPPATRLRARATHSQLRAPDHLKPAPDHSGRQL